MKNDKWFALYSLFPVTLQNMACSFAGFKIRRGRYNKTFFNALKFLRQMQWAPFTEQQEYQNEQLRVLISHAYSTVPYYRKVFEEANLKPEDIQSTKDLIKLPILQKSTVRKRFKDLHSKGWPKNRIRHGHTGGTTGTSLQLISDIDTQPWQWAIWWRHRERFNLKITDPFIVFGGRNVVPLTKMDPPVWRRNLPMHQTYLSIHHLTKQNMPIVADYLRRRRVKYYSGYPSALYQVACYFLANNVHLPYPPSIVVTGAETLLPHQRDIISKAFNSDVADQYGASEQCGNISECEKHKYHVDMEFGVIEFLPIEGMPVNIRRIICTGFHNMAMPLIRYDIGDIVTLSDEPCTCGRQSPIVMKIDGRIESYVITPDGRQLGRLDFLFKDSSKIEEAQLVQNDIQTLIANIVPSEGYSSSDEQSLLVDMRKYLGNKINIEFRYLNTIPREANGKFRQIVSYVFKDRYEKNYNTDMNS